MTAEAALALIATLPRNQAEAVMLRAVISLDANAAAQVLGKRPGAVRTAPGTAHARRPPRRTDVTLASAPTLRDE